VSRNILIKDGGKVLIAGGQWSKQWDTWKDHPQLIWWTGEQKDIKRELINHSGYLPDNVKGVILSRYISHSESGQIIAEARKKRALIMPMLNDGEITRLLEEITTPTVQTNGEAKVKIVQPVEPEPVEQETDVTMHKPGRGEMARFVAEHHKTDLITSLEGERLFAIAKKSGLQTTVGSMKQSIFKYRKDLGVVVGSLAGKKTSVGVPRTEKAETKAVAPAPRTPEPATENDVDLLLKMVEDSITGLQLIKEHVVKLNKQNVRFMKMKQKLADLLGGD
jgi:hypothetical protein